MEELTKAEYEQFKQDDRFIHNVAYAVTCCNERGEEEYKKAMTTYTTAKQDFKVTEQQIKIAKKEYDKRKQDIIKNIKNKLVFVGMGMDFKPSTINHIGNHRIRTYFKNNKGVVCFVEFGTSLDKDFLRCDHALINTKKNNSDWESLNERENTEKRISLEGIRGGNIPYTKKSILELINKNFDCSFKEVEVYSYFLNTDDYTSISKEVV